MASVYTDTSGLGRLLLDEADAAAVRQELARYERRVASQLVRAELCRLASRNGLESEAERILETIVIVPLTPELLRAAERIQPDSVATLDAIHLSTAVQLRDARQISALLTFDRALAVGAAAHGLDVVAPAA